MATTTAKKKDAVADADSPVLAQDSTDTNAVPAAPVAVVFVDKEFTSRTLFLDDLRPVVVSAGRVTATDAEELAFLQGRKDFEPLE